MLSCQYSLRQAFSVGSTGSFNMQPHVVAPPYGEIISNFDAVLEQTGCKEFVEFLLQYSKITSEEWQLNK